MASPLVASSFYITTKTRKISFIHPIKGFSIWNDGPDSIKVWTTGGGQHTIKISESLDITSDYAVREIYGQSLGTSTIRFAGVKKWVGDGEPTEITRVFNPQKQYAYQVDTTSPQIDYTLLLIVLGVVAIVGIVAMVVSKR